MKVIKWVLLIILLLVVLVVAGVGIAVATLDPNDYKPQIAEQVKKQTGRDLTITGDMGWSVFPWLGVSIGQTSLGNAEGFGDEPFVHFNEVDVHVKLMPLLTKKIQVSTVTLKDLQINLTRKADGQDNWSDLAAASEEDKEDEKVEPSGGAPDFSLAVDGVEILNASLVYDDQQGGTKVEVSPLNINAGSLEFGQAMPAEIDFKAVMDQITVAASMKGDFTLDPKQNIYHIESDLDADVSMQEEAQTIKTNAKGRLIADPMAGQFALGKVTIDTNLSGEGYPEAGIDTRLQADIKADTEKQTIAVDQLTFTLADLILKGQVAVEQFIDGAKYSGKLSSDTFSPKALMQQLGMAPPETAKADALQSAKIDVSMTGDTTQVSLKPIKVQLDQSSLTGEFSVKDFATTALRYNLIIDKLNADHYLPGSTAAEGKEEAVSAAAEKPASDDKIALPVEMLKGLNVAGTAKINEFIVNKLLFTNASMTTNAKNGVLKVNPLSANAYQGKAVINATLDVTPAQPKYKTDMKLNGVRSEEILKVLFNEPYVSGAAEFAANLTTSGDRVSSLKKSLNGQFNAAFRDGSIKGSKLSETLTQAKNGLNKVRGKPPIKRPLTGETQFNLMKASGNIKNGVVSNKDLEVETPIAYIKGEGTASLPAETVNYTVYMADKKKDGKEDFLPIKISGPFSKLGYDIKLGSLAKQQMKKEVDAEKEKAKKKLEEKIDKKTDKLKEKLGDELGEDLGNKLKDLFK